MGYLRKRVVREAVVKGRMSEGVREVLRKVRTVVFTFKFSFGLGLQLEN